MKIKTSKLTGAALDWAVAKCVYGDDIPAGFPAFSQDWAQGGPIIEREKIGIGYGVGIDAEMWEAGYTNPEETGPTPLIAAMRCYVASKLGDEVDIPEGLI